MTLQFGITPDITYKDHEPMTLVEASKIYKNIKYAHNIQCPQDFNDIFLQIQSKTGVLGVKDSIIEELLAKNIVETNDLRKQLFKAIKFSGMIESLTEQQQQYEQQSEKSLNTIKELKAKLIQNEALNEIERDENKKIIKDLKNQLQTIGQENKHLKENEVKNGKYETIINDLNHIINTHKHSISLLKDENNLLKDKEIENEKKIKTKEDETHILHSKLKGLERKHLTHQTISYSTNSHHHHGDGETSINIKNFGQQMTTQTTTVQPIPTQLSQYSSSLSLSSPTPTPPTPSPTPQPKEEEEEEIVVTQPIPNLPPLSPPSFVVYITEQTFLENINENFQKFLQNCRVETLPGDPKRINRNNSLIIFTKNVFGARTDSDADSADIKNIISRYRLNNNDRQPKYPIIHASFIFGKAFTSSFVSISNDLCECVQIAYDSFNKGFTKSPNRSSLNTIQSVIDHHCENNKNNKK